MTKIYSIETDALTNGADKVHEKRLRVSARASLEKSCIPTGLKQSILISFTL